MHASQENIISSSNGSAHIQTGTCNPGSASMDPIREEPRNCVLPSEHTHLNFLTSGESSGTLDNCSWGTREQFPGNTAPTHISLAGVVAQ